MDSYTYDSKHIGEERMLRRCNEHILYIKGVNEHLSILVLVQPSSGQLLGWHPHFKEECHVWLYIIRSVIYLNWRMTEAFSCTILFILLRKCIQWRSIKYVVDISKSCQKWLSIFQHNTRWHPPNKSNTRLWQYK